MTINQKSPKEVVLLMDTTYWKRDFGVMVFKDAHSGTNLLKYYVKKESATLYWHGIKELEQQGFIIKAIVCDGYVGVIQRLSKAYIVQFCQYHQASIIRRYLSLNPRYDAGKDLKLIANLLCYSSEEQMRDYLEQWWDKWESYYKERKFDVKKGKTVYAHKRIESAYNSLKTNLPYLFNYQKYPELNIPNTSNKLEGYFAHLKLKTRCHQGISLAQKMKMIDEILGV